MMRINGFHWVYIVMGLMCLHACKQAPAAEQKSSEMPAGAKPVAVQITDLNCFIERGQFFVTGICNNSTNQWQQIWLRMEPSKRDGKAIYMQGERGAVFPVFSAAIPPKGRSAFFQGWDGKLFTGVPDTCSVVCAGAIPAEAGPILLVEEKSMVRMVTPAVTGKEPQEIGRQFSAVVSNPLDKPAKHPCVEVLLYGNDKRLWFVSLLDLTQELPTLRQDGSGDIAPGTKRRFNTEINYYNLPAQLVTHKIGAVDAFSFEQR